MCVYQKYGSYTSTIPMPVRYALYLRKKWRVGAENIMLSKTGQDVSKVYCQSQQPYV